MVSQHLRLWLIYVDSPNIVSSQINSKRCDVISIYIIGINDDSILRKLLPESDPNLAKVMEIATACMKSAENLRVISN